MFIIFLLIFGILGAGFVLERSLATVHVQKFLRQREAMRWICIERHQAASNGLGRWYVWALLLL